MNGLSLPQRIAVTEFLSKHFTAVRKEELNPEAVSEMTVGERYAARFGDTVAAWVSLPKPAARAKVTNDEALLAWAKKHLPQAVETVERVRPETARALGDEMKRRGGWLNRETGEVIPVDGIEVSTGDPSPRVELQDEAAEAIAEAWRNGDIDPALLLALPAAQETGEAA
jgi:hypothetical protein